MSNAQDIQRVAKVIAEKFHPQKIILFGSRAYGTPTPDSDTDLLIILPFEGSHFSMMSEMLSAIRPAFGFELIPRTPEDVAQRYAQGDWFIRDAIDKGIVLYEAAA